MVCLGAILTVKSQTMYKNVKNVVLNIPCEGYLLTIRTQGRMLSYFSTSPGKVFIGGSNLSSQHVSGSDHEIDVDTYFDINRF